jgi:hypothetical protein
VRRSRASQLEAAVKQLLHFGGISRGIGAANPFARYFAGELVSLQRDG